MEFRKPVWQNVPRACASATSSLRRDNAAPNMGETLLLRDCSYGFDWEQWSETAWDASFIRRSEEMLIKFDSRPSRGTPESFSSSERSERGDPDEWIYLHEDKQIFMLDGAFASGRRALSASCLVLFQARASTIKILAANSRDIPAASRERERERERERPKLVVTRDTAPRDTAMHYLLKRRLFLAATLRTLHLRRILLLISNCAL